MADPIDDPETDDSSIDDILPAESFWIEEARRLFVLLTPLIISAVLKGAQNAADDLETRLGVSIDMKLVNKAAQKWAKDYTFKLVKGITDTTRDYLRDQVSKWVESGDKLSDLTKALREGGMFDARRAELVASTEATRAYAEGNTTTWRESGVVSGRRWYTVVDERVCPICGALHEQEVGIDEAFEDEAGNPIDNPPAHPNCRCYVQPIVEE